MDDDRNIHWSSQLETLIASEAERARGLAWIHLRAEQIFSTRNNYIQIPVIVLSTLAGTASVGSSSLFPDDTKLGSIIIGLVSITCGILNTIQSYFSFARKAESHKGAYLAYSKLFQDISIELSLPRNERVSPNQLLSELRAEIKRLSETTPTPPQYILDLFNTQFKNEDKSIARPYETNGLHKLSIYKSSEVSLEKIAIQVDEEGLRHTNPLRMAGEGRTPRERSENQSSLPRQETRDETGQRGESDQSS
jgi:hypothetical protein